MSGVRIVFAIVALLLAGPASAQGIFDDFFGPPPKPKATKRPPAASQPAPVKNPAAVQQPGSTKKTPTSAKPADPAATAAKPPAAKAGHSGRSSGETVRDAARHRHIRRSRYATSRREGLDRRAGCTKGCRHFARGTGGRSRCTCSNLSIANRSTGRSARGGKASGPAAAAVDRDSHCSSGCNSGPGKPA